MFNLEQAQERINGMRWNLNGIDGVLSVERNARGMTEYIHTASKNGKRTKKYRQERENLGDDYVTDLSQDIDELGKIFAAISE